MIPTLIGLALVLSAAGPGGCDATAPPPATHAAGHTTAADTACHHPTTPGCASGGPFALTSLYFLSFCGSPSLPLASLSPDPMPPEA